MLHCPQAELVVAPAGVARTAADGGCLSWETLGAQAHAAGLGLSRGGLAQGVGEVMRERVVYDRHGQIITASLMDYAVPRARDIPPVDIGKVQTRSSADALGAKGVGEAGCIGVPAAIINAAIDAVSPFGVSHLDMPLTGETIWRAINTGHARGAATP